MRKQRQKFKQPEEKPRQKYVVSTETAENQQEKADEQKTREEQEELERLQDESLKHRLVKSDPGRRDEEQQELQPENKAAQIIKDARKGKEFAETIDRYCDFAPWQILHETSAEFIGKQPDQDHEQNEPTREQERTADELKRETEERMRDAKEHAGLENFIRECREQASNIHAVEEHHYRSVWQTVCDLDYKKDKDLNQQEERIHDEKMTDLHPVLLSYDEHNAVREKADRLSITHYHQEKAEKNLTDENLERDEEHQSFSCYVPTDLASKLSELGPLEPETMKYLHGEYGCIERHVLRSAERSDDEIQTKDFAHAAQHAQETLQPMRDDICTERSERADLQIEELKSAKAEGQASYLQDYIEITYNTNEKDACYEMQGAKQVAWEKAELPTALQNVLDQREDRELRERLEQQFQKEENQRTNDQIEKRQDAYKVVCFRSDILQKEEADLNHVLDEEPPPSAFYCALVFPTYMQIVKEFEARNWEEFDQQRMGFPPTDECRAYVDEMDKIWKEWKHRVRRQQDRVDNSRSLAQEYDHEDYDR